MIGVASTARWERTRNAMVRTFPRGGVGAELGVFRGEFSKVLLEVTEPAQLYLVDLFSGWCSSGDANGEHVRSVNMSEELVRLRDDQFRGNSRVWLVQADSVTWLQAQAEDSLDWVYIDTDHTFARTWHEINEASRVVKLGGIISGHDYHPRFPGVMEAVHAVCEKHNWTLDVWGWDSLPSYRIVNRKGCA